MPTDLIPPLGHSCQVFPAAEIFVSSGANLGDGLGLPETVCAGDVYELDVDARPLRLALHQSDEHLQTIAAGSEVGKPGDTVQMIARYTLLSPQAETVEVLLLSHGQGLFALPLSPMARRMEYSLIAIDSAPVAARLSDLVCVSFARGTLITLPSGRQRGIESLDPGDRVLTRDHGAQQIRWVGRATLRAIGAFAPVVISKGVLGNAHDLIVSQHHRMFLYRPTRLPELPTAEVLVQAKHLVDGERIFLRDGGVVDYFSLIFDRHEIIYAEGIPSESLMVTEATVARLPGDLADAVAARFPDLRHDPHFGTEAGRGIAASLRQSLLGQPPVG
ncbi:MAG: hypothetical protein DI533_00815 [Cereibacter sphaeroides]|uniref:Hedgehog/Intein (Hint) domain-containing protein n=1 Tax=Cereibacter sphaeroides TaxID=1063 RepID=A0A2W5S8I1_CERSP|nr:MAG: hypothetical protein DI533_00815 [Cereibacter sphaeroides]